MENVLNRFNVDWERRPWQRTRVFPALNVWEDGDRFYAEAEVPGVKMDDMEIYASGNELTVRGQRKPLEDNEVTYHRQERGGGEFSRVITLPAEVNADKVEATLKNGVLTVMLPKAEAARMRKIQVKGT
jgi:HSP20 family protein